MAKTAKASTLNSGNPKMTKEEIRNKVQGIICDHLSIKAEEFNKESEFYDDLGCDSLDVLEMVFELEDRFSLEIPDDDIEQWKTVGDVYEYVERVMVS